MESRRKLRAAAWLAVLAMMLAVLSAAQAETWLHLGENTYMELPDGFSYRTKDKDERLLYSKQLNMTVVWTRIRKGGTLQQEIQRYWRENLVDVGITRINGIDMARGRETGKSQVTEYGVVRNTDGLYRITVVRTKGSVKASDASAAFFASLRDHTLTGLKLNTSKKVMVLGRTKTFQLKAKKTPSWSKSGIRWSSSDERVASVDGNGLLTVRGTGKCVITAEAEDGSGLKARCTVKIKAKD